MAAQYLYGAVSVQSERCVAVALNNADVDFERTNLFAANGELFERAIRCYHKGVFELLMDHFRKHFLPQPASSDNNNEEEEEDFDDYSKKILPTPFSEMKENFEVLVDLWSENISEIDKPVMAELNTIFADRCPSSNQRSGIDQHISKTNQTQGADVIGFAQGTAMLAVSADRSSSNESSNHTTRETSSVSYQSANEGSDFTNHKQMFTAAH